ncbi:MAG: DUF6338 family protein [Aurantimonas endophytica]|uniref:DUF6338 family protein n=1 Tax=Aurantimonas endophytica TaxID=1522175 RepID=UPI0030011478
MNEINSFLVAVALIFLPGLVWARIDAYYAKQVKPSEFTFILNAFIFGIVAYLVTFGLYQLWSIALCKVDFDLVRVGARGESAINSFDTALADEIIIATFVALVLSVLSLYAQNRKWVTRILQAIGATRRFGDEDVWDFVFTSSDPEASYVNVRDLAHNVVYTGVVELFSEADKMRELVLLDVEVYNSDDGSFLYHTPRIYLARTPEGMTVEFPATADFRLERHPDVVQASATP